MYNNHLRNSTAKESILLSTSLINSDHVDVIKDFWMWINVIPGRASIN